MKSVARFELVSEKQFLTDYKDSFPNMSDDEILEMYKEIKLPKRATVGSAGYDFYAPFDINLAPGETIKVPTGIRSYIENGYVLEIYPRSGLGFKYRLQLNNTVGIIDSDYYNSKNEGHIFIKIT
ncbi:MAG: dUTP diphosphatase, partial [Anaeroplasmataceae bacterium]